MTIIDDMEELSSRVDYMNFLRDKRNPPLPYEVWKEKQDIVNPLTLKMLGQL